MTNNLILNTDSYKASHFLQYPPNTSMISSYVEARGGVYDKSVFFGLQAFLKDYMTKPVTKADVDEAAEIFEAHGVPFHKAGWLHIVNKHGGLLPLAIEAIEEGTVLPVKNALVQVRNTDPEAFWLTSYIETALLRAIWYPMTVATLSWHIKQTIRGFLEETSDNTDGLAFKLHDFGARGASSEESAALGGMGHIVNFMGTDNISAIIASRKFYGANMPAFSIPAAEHSTMTSWKRENEEQAYANMLKQFGGEGKLVAVVSDSYDLFNAVENIWGGSLKAQVEQTGGTLVIRPDSGDPVEIVIATITKLMDKFGFTTNNKGYKVLPSYVRVIQGDGISSKSIAQICEAMKAHGFSLDNLAFGMGGELLQKVNRDTMQFAMKASAAEVEGEMRDVFKDPITDQGKRSKKGILAVVKDDAGHVETIRASELSGRENLLKPVFENGKLLKETSFDDVRKRSEEG
jgi:nicotinamide phosphoribosyltransferase